MKSYIKPHLVLLMLISVFASYSGYSQISGVVNYHDNPANPLPEVTMELHDSNNNLVATTITNSNGEFNFYNIPPGDYSLISSATLPVGNINLIDASLILQYLFGYYTLNDYEFEAADVNGTGTVTFSDYFILLFNYIFQGNPFPVNAWQFEEIYTSVTTSRDTVAPIIMWGTSTGDLDGHWNPVGRDLDIIEFDEQDPVTINKNSTVMLEVKSNYNYQIQGFKLNLEFPKNSLQIDDVIGPDENFHYEINNGILKVIWMDENLDSDNKFFGETLFKIKVKQLEELSQNESGMFSLVDGGMVLDTKSNEVDNLKITLPKIKTSSMNMAMDVISYPNPVLNKLNLKITSPTNCNANIYIYDLNGRIISEINNQSIFIGTQLINLDTKSFPSGYYIYKMTFGGNTIHGRFQKSN